MECEITHHKPAIDNGGGDLCGGIFQHFHLSSIVHSQPSDVWSRNTISSAGEHGRIRRHNTDTHGRGSDGGRNWSNLKSTFILFGTYRYERITKRIMALHLVAYSLLKSSSVPTPKYYS